MWFIDAFPVLMSVYTIFDGAIPANLLGQPYQVNDPDVAPTDPIGEWSYSVS